MFTKVLKTSNLWFDMYGLKWGTLEWSNMASAAWLQHWPPSTHATALQHYSCAYSPHFPLPLLPFVLSSLINKGLRQCDGAEGKGTCCISPVAWVWSREPTWKVARELTPTVWPLMLACACTMVRMLTFTHITHTYITISTILFLNNWFHKHSGLYL